MTDDSQRYCELGEKHLLRDEPEEALAWYEKATREDPENPVAWTGRGKASYHLGQLERADRYFRRALRYHKPRMTGRLAHRGWWSDDASKDYLRLLHWRALCRFWMGSYEDAARLFKRILKLVPSDPLEVRFLLGETWFRMGELDRAVREFSAAGDDPDAIYNLGLTLFYKGEFTRSVNAFRRGILENVFLACKLADLDPPPDVPSYRGTHPRELDSEVAAEEYVDRCGDLWIGRPLLQRWIRAIYVHPIVQKDLTLHLEQVGTLAAGRLAAHEVGGVEGANAVLRDPVRLTETDAEVTRDVMRQVFRLPR